MSTRPDRLYTGLEDEPGLKHLTELGGFTSSSLVSSEIPAGGTGLAVHKYCPFGQLA